MTPEDKLQSLFAAEAAPVRDPVFEAVVVQRIARRRAVAVVAAFAPLAVAMATILWGLGPIWRGLADLPREGAPVLMAAIMATVTALAVVRQVLRT